jgi:hypothetical protein
VAEVIDEIVNQLGLSADIKQNMLDITRILNGKVYDAALSFDVESTQSISSVNAVFEGYAPTIPARAYPPEDPVTLQLEPAPQSTSVTTYSARVANLKGGKQYKLSCQAKNSVGTEDIPAIINCAARSHPFGHQKYPPAKVNRFNAPHVLQ